jgi:spore coat polysaccharide biosynthesis protein SpsF
MGSTRLPGKVLFPLAGRPVLAQVVERLQRCRTADTVIVATSIRPENDVIAAWARALGVPCVRGSEEDTLGRFHLAAVEHGLDVVVRVSADCPLVDPGLLDEMVERFRQLQRDGPCCDYLTNILQRTFPRGLEVEIFTMEALVRCHQEDNDPGSREGVTVYILTHQDQFRLANFAGPSDESRHRWTLDTADDYALLSRIYDALNPAQPTFGYRDVLELLAVHPSWCSLNAHVVHREVFFSATSRPCRSLRI